MSQDLRLSCKWTMMLYNFNPLQRTTSKGLWVWGGRCWHVTERICLWEAGQSNLCWGCNWNEVSLDIVFMLLMLAQMNIKIWCEMWHAPSALFFTFSTRTSVWQLNTDWYINNILSFKLGAGWITAPVLGFWFSFKRGRDPLWVTGASASRHYEEINIIIMFLTSPGHWMSELSSFTTDCSRQFSFTFWTPLCCNAANSTDDKCLLQMFVLLFVALVTHDVTEGDFSSLVENSWNVSFAAIWFCFLCVHLCIGLCFLFLFCCIFSKRCSCQIGECFLNLLVLLWCV